MNLDTNDFELFGLPPRHAQERAELDAHWRSLQAEVHPDRFAVAGRGGAARRDAVGGARQRGLPAPEGSAQARRIPVRIARRGGGRREQQRDAGGIPDAADGLARGARRGRRRRGRRGAGRRSRRPAPRTAGGAHAHAGRAPRLRRRRATGQGADVRRALSSATSSAGSKRWDNSVMALLQISEPGASPDPHQRRIAVGIDLGTTHSLVAAVRNGVAECLPDAQGRVILPSAVRYFIDERGQAQRQVGAEALADAALDPRNTIVSVKRFMGRGLADVAQRGRLPYEFVDTPGMLQLRTVAGVKSPVEVSAEILATLRQRAEDSFDDEIFGAVITVPAYFDDAQRQATKDAAQLAGLNVLRLINEPTAAAVAYGLEHGAEGLYAVYDLGGGTFDISLLRLSSGVFEVVATGGDSALGGDDFDHLLADWALARGWPRGEHAAGQARRARRGACGEGEAEHGRSRDVRLPARERRVVGARRARAVRDPDARSRGAHARRGAQGVARRPRRALRREGRRDGRRLDADADGAGGGGRVLRPDAADRPQPGRGGRARRRAAGEPARRQRRGRRDPAARRDPAVARPRDDGRAGRAHHPAQQHDPLRARAGLHDLQGRPDRARAARGAGRTRTGGRLPLAGAFRVARHSADGGRRGAHPGQLPGRCRRPAEREGARGTLGRRGGDRRQAELRPGRRRHRSHAAGGLSQCRRRHAGARAAPVAGRGRAHAARHAVGAGRRRRPARAGRARRGRSR